ncbi:MAG TPA: methyltransferase [Elusimicrobiota bacterium]|nr:methyltransferase [Elusimicrobiota bacterium]
MTPPKEPPLPPVPRAAPSLRWFRRRLNSALTEKTIAHSLHLRRPDLLFASHEHFTQNTKPSGNPLIRLFYQGLPLTDTQAQKTLTGQEWRELSRAGLITRENGRFRSPFIIRPIKGFLILSDRETRRDSVYPVQYDSALFAELQFRRTASTLLDLCTGTGVHVLLSSIHSGKAWGGDINPRSVRLASWNARFNGVRNASFRRSDLFRSFGDRKYDVLLANTPFRPTLRSRRTLWSDGGTTGSEIGRRILDGLNDHLTPNGIFQILTSRSIRPFLDSEWEHRHEWDVLCLPIPSGLILLNGRRGIGRRYVLPGYNQLTSSRMNDRINSFFRKI